MAESPKLSEKEQKSRVSVLLHAVEDAIKKGDLEIDLPPIKKEAIDQNMRTLSIVEKAVGTAM